MFVDAEFVMRRKLQKFGVHAHEFPTVYRLT